MLEQSLDYFRQFQVTATGLSLDILRGAAAFLIFAVLARVVRKAAKAAVGKMSTQGHVDYIIAQLAYAAVLVIGAVVALSATGRFNVATLVTSLGLAGFAVGFAVKDVLGNFLAGLLILVQRPFTLGDEISLPGAEGRVESIRVRETLVKTDEGSLLYVPNSIVFNSIVANRSAVGFRMAVSRFKCDRQVDVGKVFELGERILAERSDLLKEPPPRVILAALGDDYLEFELKFAVNSREFSVESIKSSLLRQINDNLVEGAARTLMTSEASGEESP